jgi:hypothetical protein
VPPAAPTTPARPDPHPLEPIRRVLVLGAVGFAVAAPVVALLGWFVDGSAGLLGALLGLAVPAVFFGITAAVALLTLHLSPGTTGAVVLASWLAKLIVLIVTLVLLDQSTAWSRPVFGVVFLLAVAAWLGLEAWVVLRTRQPYVQPQPSVPSRQGPVQAP